MRIVYILPLLAIVLSNTFYNIITKETPENANPFLSLAITYLVGIIISFGIYVFRYGVSNLAGDLKNLNWTSPLLGICLVALETGYIYLYRAGCPISIGSLIGNILLATILLIIGVLFYHDTIGVKQVFGIVLCMAGLVFINLK